MNLKQDVLSEGHPNTLDSMEHLGLTFMNHGPWMEAEALEVSLSESSKTILGAKHPSTLRRMRILARTWKSQDRLKDAVALLDECEKLRASCLGANHPDIIETLSVHGNGNCAISLFLEPAHWKSTIFQAG